MAGAVAPDGYPYTNAHFEPVCPVAPKYISEAGSSPRCGIHVAKNKDTKVADEPTLEKTSSPTDVHGPNASQNKPNDRSSVVTSSTADNNSTGSVEVNKTSRPAFASGDRRDEELNADRGCSISLV